MFGIHYKQGGEVGLDGSGFTGLAGGYTASSDGRSSTRFESSTELLADAEEYAMGKYVCIGAEPCPFDEQD